MDNNKLVVKLLSHIGTDAEVDKVLAEACLALMEEPEEKPKEKPKAKAKPKAKPKASKFDMGKLKALLDGGWSVSKIADEMGVSQQTVYNKMKTLQEQENEL